MILSLFRSKPLPKVFHHAIAGDIPVRVHAWAKRLTLKFDPAKGFAITAAPSTKWAEIETFIRSYDHWIIGRHDQRQSVDLSQVLYQGIPYKIIKSPVNGRSLYHLDHENHHLTIDPSLCQDSLNIRFIFEREFKKILPDLMDKLNHQTGLTPKRLTLRDPKSRWGSCSSQGNISLSWRLFMTPPEVMEYVIIHELAHLKHMDHSKSFWQLVALHCPAYRQYIQWLKIHGSQIMGIAG